MNNEKKFLDQAGVEYLWSKIDMQDYPNNEILTAVINAIDENKADKEYVDEKIENSIITSWNDLEDRPFYEEEEETLTIIVPEVTISGSNSYYENPFNIEIIEGNNYTVKFDGVTYECTAYIAEGPNTPSIGNGTIADAGTVNNNEPFFCTVYNGNVMLFTGDSDTHTIEIISDTVTTVIHKIDKKFLPDGVVNVQPDWLQEDSTAADYIKNKPVINNQSNNYTSNGLVMIDQRTGYRYVIQILDGNIISSGYCLDIRISDKCKIKDKYVEGEPFSVNDIILEGICDDGTIKVIDHYTTDVIDNTVVITYKEVDNVFKLNVTTIVDIETGLQDFYYTKGDDGIYTLTGWKGTYNGESSTKCIVPNSTLVKLQ